MAHEWYIIVRGEEQGPFPSSKIRSLAKAGKIKPDRLLRRSDKDRAVPAGKIKGLLPEEAAEAPAPAAPPPPPRGPEPVAAAQPAPGGKRGLNTKDLPLLFYVVRGAEEEGPYDKERLAELAREGAIDPDTRLRNVALDFTNSAKRVKGLFTEADLALHAHRKRERRAAAAAARSAEPAVTEEDEAPPPVSQRPGAVLYEASPYAVASVDDLHLEQAAAEEEVEAVPASAAEVEEDARLFGEADVAELDEEVSTHRHRRPTTSIRQTGSTAFWRSTPAAEPEPVDPAPPEPEPVDLAPPAEPVAEAVPPAPVAPVAPTPVEPLAAAEPAAAPPPADDDVIATCDEIYIPMAVGEVGPITREQLYQFLFDGEVESDDEVRLGPGDQRSTVAEVVRCYVAAGRQEAEEAAGVEPSEAAADIADQPAAPVPEVAHAAADADESDDPRVVADDESTGSPDTIATVDADPEPAADPEPIPAADPVLTEPESEPGPVAAEPQPAVEPEPIPADGPAPLVAEPEPGLEASEAAQAEAEDEAPGFAAPEADATAHDHADPAASEMSSLPADEEPELPQEDLQSVGVDEEVDDLAAMPVDTAAPVGAEAEAPADTADTDPLAADPVIESAAAASDEEPVADLDEVAEPVVVDDPASELVDPPAALSDEAEPEADEPAAVASAGMVDEGDAIDPEADHDPGQSAEDSGDAAAAGLAEPDGDHEDLAEDIQEDLVDEADASSAQAESAAAKPGLLARLFGGGRQQRKRPARSRREGKTDRRRRRTAEPAAAEDGHDERDTETVARAPAERSSRIEVEIDSGIEEVADRPPVDAEADKPAPHQAGAPSRDSGLIGLAESQLAANEDADVTDVRPSDRLEVSVGGGPAVEGGNPGAANASERREPLVAERHGGIDVVRPPRPRQPAIRRDRIAVSPAERWAALQEGDGAGDDELHAALHDLMVEQCRDTLAPASAPTRSAGLLQRFGTDPDRAQLERLRRRRGRRPVGIRVVQASGSHEEGSIVDPPDGRNPEPDGSKSEGGHD